MDGVNFPTQDFSKLEWLTLKDGKWVWMPSNTPADTRDKTRLKEVEPRKKSERI